MLAAFPLWPSGWATEALGPCPPGGRGDSRHPAGSGARSRGRARGGGLGASKVSGAVGEARPRYRMKTRVPGGNGTCSRPSCLWPSQRTDQSKCSTPWVSRLLPLFIRPLTRSPNAPGCVVARTGRRTRQDSELSPGQAGVGRGEEKAIRLEGDCGDGGSRGQGRGARQTAVHGVRGEGGIPDRRNSNYKGLEEGDGEKGTWTTKTRQKTVGRELGGQRE